MLANRWSLDSKQLSHSFLSKPQRLIPYNSPHVYIFMQCAVQLAYRLDLFPDLDYFCKQSCNPNGFCNDYI